MKTLLKLAQERGTTIPIINRVCIKDDMAYATNLDVEISSPLPNFESGIWYPYLDVVKVKDEECPVEDFPDLKIGDETGLLATYKRKDLLDALLFCQPAQSTEATRYYLNGVYFHDTKMVATNGHILKAIDTGVAVQENMILPRQAVSYLIALLKEKKDVETVDLQTHRKGFKFTIGDTVLKSKLVDGTYPNYTAVVPNHEKHTDFDLGQISQYKKQIVALKKIACTKTPVVSVSSGLMKWHGIGSAYGMAFPINLQLDVEIGFNYNYLLSMMSGKMSYGSATDPVKIEQDNKLCVIMPMRV